MNQLFVKWLHTGGTGICGVFAGRGEGGGWGDGGNGSNGGSMGENS